MKRSARDAAPEPEETEAAAEDGDLDKVYCICRKVLGVSSRKLLCFIAGFCWGNDCMRRSFLSYRVVSFSLRTAQKDSQR